MHQSNRGVLKLEPLFWFIRRRNSNSGRSMENGKIPWQGPYKVIKKLNATNYVVKHSSRARDFVVHGDSMKPYFGEIDVSAWPADRQDSQQPGPGSAGIASTSDQSMSSQQPPAQLGPAQTDSQRPASGKGRSRDSAGRPARSAPPYTANTGRTYGNYGFPSNRHELCLSLIHI